MKILYNFFAKTISLAIIGICFGLSSAAVDPAASIWDQIAQKRAEIYTAENMRNVMENTYNALAWLATGEFPKESMSERRRKANPMADIFGIDQTNQEDQRNRQMRPDKAHRQGQYGATPPPPFPEDHPAYKDWQKRHLQQSQKPSAPKRAARPPKIHQETGLVLESKHQRQMIDGIHHEHLTTKGHARNDTLDLELVQFTSNALNQSDLPEDLQQIWELEEIYPTAEAGCQNNGQLQTQKQNIYKCKSQHFNNGEQFRVTKEQYQKLDSYSDLFTCQTYLEHTNVCMCSPAYTGNLCASKTTIKCQVQITSPNLLEGCPDRGDSAYYTFSLQGFAPCWPLDFSQSYPVQFQLKCMAYNTTAVSVSKMETAKPKAGYFYRDVVEHAQFDEQLYQTQMWQQQFISEKPTIKSQQDLFSKDQQQRLGQMPLLREGNSTDGNETDGGNSTDDNSTDDGNSTDGNSTDGNETDDGNSTSLVCNSTNNCTVVHHYFNIDNYLPMVVQINLRDFKFLTNTYTKNYTVNDPDVLFGNSRGFWNIDFSEMEASDAAGLTKFVVGGRIYFEAKVYANGTDSFVTQGFFDKEGYVEPVSHAHKRSVIIWTGSVLILILVAALAILYYFFCHKKEQRALKKRQMEKIHEE